MQSVNIFFRFLFSPFSFLSVREEGKLLVCQEKDLFSPREVHHNKLAFTTGAGHSVVGWIRQIRVPLVILGNNYLLRRFPVLPALPARWFWAQGEGKRNCCAVLPPDRPSHDNATNQINNFSWAKQVEKIPYLDFSSELTESSHFILEIGMLVPELIELLKILKRWSLFWHDTQDV